MFDLVKLNLRIVSIAISERLRKLLVNEDGMVFPHQVIAFEF